MKKCQFEDQIDGYLMNKLEGEDRDIFEEHYFNCPKCFQKMQERDEIISAIKTRGVWIFKEESGPARKAFVPAFERVTTFFTPRQWATVATAAALFFVIVFGVLPQFRSSAPRFVLSEKDVVRGKTLSLISPVIDVKAAPAFFEWTELGGDAEYKIYVSNHGLLWTAATKDTRIAVPDEIRRLMTAGENYSWQVRAFSSKGTLIAVSSKVQFQIEPTE
ncbi:MAG: zf-HC2 domain-containing protein [Clostridiales bacterium]|nr:zf-HC2 domain-containing protein [Clostridiales bacterium]